MPNAAAVVPETLDPKSHTPHLTRTGEGNHALNPKPYTLYPIPYTLYPTPYTIHPTPYTPHLSRKEEGKRPAS